MSEPRKVNWKNVVMVLGIGFTGTVVGFIDRVVNYVRPIENFYLWLASSKLLGEPTVPAAANWYNSSASISTTMDSMSGFGMFGLIVIGLVGVISILIMTSFGFRAGM